MQEVKERVHKQTDNLLADFDESTKSGLLEELKKAMVTAALKEEKKKAELERPKVVKVADIAKMPAVTVDEEPEEISEPEAEDEDIQEAVQEVIAEEKISVEESLLK